jgi:predicted Zn-ribbon and HTH transcriptional regulator
VKHTTITEALEQGADFLEVNQARANALAAEITEALYTDGHESNYQDDGHGTIHFVGGGFGGVVRYPVDCVQCGFKLTFQNQHALVCCPKCERIQAPNARPRF